MNKNALYIVIIILSVFSNSTLAKGLDKTEREEYIACEKMAFIVNEYDLDFVDQSPWIETRELYIESMTALQKNKADKKVKKETKKIKKVLQNALSNVHEVQDEHIKYVIFTAVVADKKANETFYGCF